MTRGYLTARFDCGSTVPGTRSFHLFVPQGKGVVSYKRCADDDEFAGTHDFSKILVKQLLMFMLMIIVQPGVTNVGG